MPFPLAHPAAALLLRRWCAPRGLNFSALVIGTLVPDFGYCLGKSRANVWSHSFWPGIAFDVSAGWLIFWVFHHFKRRLHRLPCLRHKWLNSPTPLPPLISPLLLLSLAIGSGTHVFLDSMTHRGGWLVKHLSILRSPVLRLGTHELPLHDLLYYQLTFAGSAWVAFCVLNWMERFPADTRRTGWKYAIALSFAAILVIITAVVRG